MNKKSEQCGGCDRGQSRDTQLAKERTFSFFTVLLLSVSLLLSLLCSRYFGSKIWLKSCCFFSSFDAFSFQEDFIFGLLCFYSERTGQWREQRITGRLESNLGHLLLGIHKYSRWPQGQTFIQHDSILRLIQSRKSNSDWRSHQCSCAFDWSALTLWCIVVTEVDSSWKVIFSKMKWFLWWNFVSACVKIVSLSVFNPHFKKQMFSVFFFSQKVTDMHQRVKELIIYETSKVKIYENTNVLTSIIRHNNW